MGGVPFGLSPLGVVPSGLITSVSSAKMSLLSCQTSQNPDSNYTLKRPLLQSKRPDPKPIGARENIWKIRGFSQFWRLTEASHSPQSQKLVDGQLSLAGDGTHHPFWHITAMQRHRHGQIATSQPQVTAFLPHAHEARPNMRTISAAFNAGSLGISVNGYVDFETKHISARGGV
jgi:hypothetical protein